VVLAEGGFEEAGRVGWTEPSPRPGAAVVVLRWPLDADGVERACASVDRLLRAGAAVVACDVAAIAAPDLAAVDALARLQLAARRAGGHVEVRGAGDGLRQLLALAGLADVVPVDDAPD
jgi:ABC-type transporter Mla MlaB component